MMIIVMIIIKTTEDIYLILGMVAKLGCYGIFLFYFHWKQSFSHQLNINWMLNYLSGVPENLTKDGEPFHNPKADILKNLLAASAHITANKISADTLVVDLSCFIQ